VADDGAEGGGGHGAGPRATGCVLSIGDRGAGRASHGGIFDTPHWSPAGGRLCGVVR
jgi:hypothetical protein